MTQLTIEKTGQLALAKALLARHAPTDYGTIAEDQVFLAALATLNVVELTDLVDSLKIAEGDARTVAVYELWIQLSQDKPGQVFAACYNLGVNLRSRAATDQAFEAFKRALALKPDFYQAAINAGLCAEEKGDAQAALTIWRTALQGDEARTSLLNHIGRLLENLRNYDEAERALLTSLLTDPAQPDAIHHWVGIRAKTCNWPVFLDLPGLSRQALKDSTGALCLLAVTDDSTLQDKANARWIARKFTTAQPRLSPVEGYAHDRLRIGYLSSDLCMHPMAFLIADLIEEHDRARFEIYGYCSTKEDNSEVRRRLLAGFDHVRLVLPLSDEDLAKAIREDEIDILIDLNGLTLGTRMQALRWRPAPVQATYLGYNGTIPLEELDYIIADRFVIPPETAAAHQPPPLYLPGCYQSNDRKLPVGPRETRQDAGLPDDRFVFCCFSNNYKITEEMFAAWTTILKRSENAVLWLYADSVPSGRNLARHFNEAGLDPSRLYFAARAEASRYRARLALADLFLDTWPYNSGTTASDALRVGLPIVTLTGRSFISRMAGSLLHTVGLGECVVDTLDAYIELAVALANDPARQAGIRAKIAGDTWARTLGDTPTFTRGLEAALESVAIRRG